MNQKHSWGGLRVPGPGKKLGSPPKYDTPMVQKTIRLPEDWISRLLDEFEVFQWAIESIVADHLEEQAKPPRKRQLDDD